MKKILRERAKNTRKFISSNEKDISIINNLFRTKEYQNAKNVLLYYPLKYEINPLECLKDKTKNFYLPRVNGEKLEICPYDGSLLKTGSFGIKEPLTQPIDVSIIDFIITPAVACDLNGFRLGYGKGFYDKLFAEIPENAVKICLVYRDLIFDSVFPEAHDKKCNIAVCEDFVLKF